MHPDQSIFTIKTADSGFYDGFNRTVAVTSKIIVGSLILWAMFFPEQAGNILNNFKSFILSNFASWYIWCVAIYILTCAFLAIWPASGKLVLGKPGDKPEFAYFSWFSMMFGAGIGVGMMTWAIAEPVIHLQNNPEVIQGLAQTETAGNVINAYKWSFLHWGLGPWACYALVGLALAFYSYRRDLPLTVRSALLPIFGKHLSGPIGNVVDIVAVVATILGASQALGYGVEQFVSGLYRIGLGEWLLNEKGTASSSGIIAGLTLIMVATTLSALSGVGKGIKWLSNISLVFSLILLSFFLIVGASSFGLSVFFFGTIEYITTLPELLFKVWKPDNTDMGNQLAAWQESWTVFYWAWCVAFAPFVGMFLARISRGRTIREFAIGALVMPALMSFIWFAWGGGTAVNLELTGVAQGAIINAPHGDKIFAIFEILLSPTMAWAMAALVVILVLTFLVTTADSAILVINTISSAGNEGQKAQRHIVVWGVLMGVIVASLMLVGGMDAITTSMVVGAFPFSAVMILMSISLIRSIYLESRKDKN